MYIKTYSLEINRSVNFKTDIKNECIFRHKQNEIMVLIIKDDIEDYFILTKSTWKYLEDISISITTDFEQVPY